MTEPEHPVAKPATPERRRTRHRIHGNPFNIRGEIKIPDWENVYDAPRPFALDVGFGAGRFLLELAQKNPQWNVLGLEIRQHMVDDVISDADQLGLNNAFAIVANANEHLDALIPDGALAFAALNFPDPWFKKRHQKRRVINTPWLDLLAKKMPSGGEFHYMSDFEPGSVEALELLQNHPEFVSETDGFVTESTTGIVTEREVSHHKKRGQPVHRLLFRRR